MRIAPLILAVGLVACSTPIQTQSPTMPYAESPIQTPTPTQENVPTATTEAHRPIPVGVLNEIRAEVAESNWLEQPPDPPLVENPAIIEITARHREALAALCWVEVRGMKPLVDACLSVVSTVLTRTAYRLMSDGTVDGTITRGCTKDSEWCQFPAYVWNGCEGIKPLLCPYNSPSALAIFRQVVDWFFDRGIRGSCDGYLMYGSRASDRPECQIDDGNEFLNFYRRP